MYNNEPLSRYNTIDPNKESGIGTISIPFSPIEVKELKSLKECFVDFIEFTYSEIRINKLDAAHSIFRSALILTCNPFNLMNKNRNDGHAIFLEDLNSIAYCRDWTLEKSEETSHKNEYVHLVNTTILLDKMALILLNLIPESLIYDLDNINKERIERLKEDNKDL